MNNLSKELLQEICKQAQTIYDSWDASDPETGDLEHGFGGICGPIAEAMCAVLQEHGYEAGTMDSNGMGECHCWAIAVLEDGIYSVDISPYVYESGSGYLWAKTPGVQFSASHIEVSLIEPDKCKWSEFMGAYA